VTDSPPDEPKLSFDAPKLVHVKVSKGVSVSIEEDVTFERDHGEYAEMHCPKGVVGWIVHEP